MLKYSHCERNRIFYIYIFNFKIEDYKFYITNNYYEVSKTYVLDF